MPPFLLCNLSFLVAVFLIPEHATLIINNNNNTWENLPPLSSVTFGDCLQLILEGEHLNPRNLAQSPGQR